MILSLWLFVRLIPLAAHLFFGVQASFIRRELNGPNPNCSKEPENDNTTAFILMLAESGNRKYVTDERGSSAVLHPETRIK
jgi:hypothetical protein